MLLPELMRDGGARVFSQPCSPSAISHPPTPQTSPSADHQSPLPPHANLPILNPRPPLHRLYCNCYSRLRNHLLVSIPVECVTICKNNFFYIHIDCLALNLQRNTTATNFGRNLQKSSQSRRRTPLLFMSRHPSELCLLKTALWSLDTHTVASSRYESPTHAEFSRMHIFWPALKSIKYHSVQPSRLSRSANITTHARGVGQERVQSLTDSGCPDNALTSGTLMARVVRWLPATDHVWALL